MGSIGKRCACFFLIVPALPLVAEAQPFTSILNEWVRFDEQQAIARSMFPAKHPFFFQQSDEGKRRMRAALPTLAPGMSARRVRDALGEPDDIHPMRKKGLKQALRGYRWSYRLLQYKKGLSNCLWDAHLVLILDPVEQQLQTVQLSLGTFWNPLARTIEQP